MRALHAGVLATLATACNGPPSAPVVGITPELPGTADDLTGVVIEDSVDVEDDPFVYAWRWSVDGVVQEDLVTPEVPADRTVRGQVWELAVSAFDGELVGDAGVVEITIANTPPTAIVSLSPALPTTDEDLVASAEGSDLDADPVELRYAWTVDGADAAWSEATVPAERTRSGQVWAVTVTPSDDADDGPGVAAEVGIDNTAPTLRVARITPDAPVEASHLAIEVDAEDPDADDLDVRVTWFVDGVQAKPLTDGTLDGSAFSRGQAVHAEVRVFDGSVESEPVLTAPVVIRNTPPAARVVRIRPVTLFADSVASVAGGDWTDDDGDAEDYRVAWTVDGGPPIESATLDGSAFGRDQVVSCTAWPWDGLDLGEPLQCDALTVQNSAPTLDSVGLSPSPGRTGDDLTASPGTTFDADGDEISVSYAWTVNGTSVSGSGDTLAASATGKGDVVVVTATPSDGHKTGAPATGTLTVANTAPTVTSAVLSPSPLKTRDEATVSWALADVDGDPATATVSWTVDGASAGTGTRLSWTRFERGETVEATVVPTDGEDAGAPRVISAVVANTRPSSPSPLITPSYPEETDDLVCTIDKASTDDDGDPLTYRFTWMKNLKPFTAVTTTTITGDTVDASELGPGDRFACTAIANDGFVDSGDSWPSTVRVAGGTVSGFSGERGPAFTGWTQCEGYWDTSATGEIPADWGSACTDAGFSRLRLVCGASSSSYRYIDVSKNVFRDKLSSYPETGIVTDAADQGGTGFSITNGVWAESNDPYKGKSWWAGSSGCDPTATNLTVNNRCTYEAANCFGQGLTSTSRYLWVYAGY